VIYNAISIKQPWAHAILHFGKDVENRTWDLPRKFFGKTVLIHAGKRFDDAAYLHFKNQRYPMPPFSALRTGGIVGELTFSAHITPGPRSPWAEPGMHWWHISSARPLSYFPCKGSLGFFTVDYPHEVPS
jgi:hypothetical protein